MYLVLNSLASHAKGDFEFTPALITAYSDIQKLRIEKARSVLDLEAGKGTKNGVIPYLESYSDFFFFLITDSQREYSRFLKSQEDRLEFIEGLSDESPYQRMFMAEVRLHSAFVKLKFGNRTSGCWDIIKANRLLLDNLKKFPDFIPQLKALGLLHVMIGSVPEEYQWVARLMGLRGSIKEGMAELKRVETGSRLFAKEARVTSLLLHAYILAPDEEMIQRLRELPYNEPDNLLFHFLSASILMKRGQSEAALAILQQAPAANGYLPFPFLHYMKAEINLQKGLYPSARASYVDFIKHTRGVNFVKDSFFKQYLCQWLDGQPADKGILASVAKVGGVNVEADKHARKVAEQFLAGRIGAEQKVLFEARYAFDGGFISRARSRLKGLTEQSFKLPQARVEYLYRMGRIAQHENENSEALRFFEKTVTQSEGTDLYFGASAALQLGYLYQEAGDPRKAAVYFRKAMSFKRHEYKNSIDNKARAALTEMGVK